MRGKKQSIVALHLSNVAFFVFRVASVFQKLLKIRFKVLITN